MNKQRNYSTSSILNHPPNSSIKRHYSPQGALRLDEENNNVIDIAMARLNTSLNNLDIASLSSCSNKIGVGSLIKSIDNNSNILLKNHNNNNVNNNNKKDCQMNENDLDIYQINNNKKVINITNNNINRNNKNFNGDILTINNNNNMDEKKNEDENIADILIENTNLNDSTSIITSKQSSNKLKTSKLIKMFQPTSNNSDIINDNTSNNNIDLLPPLPSSSISSSSSTNLSKSSSLNNGSIQTNNSNSSGTDFDRNLHLRRSKRYGRQLQQPNSIVIQDININNNDTTSSGSSSEHTSPTTYNSPSPSIVISGLTKAISTPSILDKLNNDSNNVKTTTVKVNASEDLINDKNNNIHYNLSNNNNNNNTNNNQNDLNDLGDDTLSSSTSTSGKHSKSVASLIDSSSNSKIISSNFHSQILPTSSSTNLNQSTNEDINNNDSLSKKAAKKAIQTINSYKLINSSSNLTMDNSCNSKKFAQNSSNGGNHGLFCF